MLDRFKQMPGHCIRRAQQVSSACFSNELAEFDLTSVQMVALVAIADQPGIDATRLAEIIDFDRATIGGVVDRLERKGLIRRTVSPRDKRSKTITVLIERRTKHELYGKIVAKTSKYHAHDESNEYKNGDVVEISESRPISKTKAWVVTKLVQKAREV